MAAADCLVRVRSILKHRDRWNQGTAARNFNGEPCSPDSEQATRFSLLGAIDYVATVNGDQLSRSETVVIVGSVLAKRMGFSLPPPERGIGAALDLISAFTEVAEHSDVLQLVDIAIRSQE